MVIIEPYRLRIWNLQEYNYEVIVMNEKLMDVVAEIINDAQKRGKSVYASLDPDMSKRVDEIQKKEEKINRHDTFLDANSRGGFYTFFHNSQFENYKTKRKGLSLSEKIEADKFQVSDFLPFEIGLKKRMDRGASIHPYSSKDMWLYDMYQTLSIPVAAGTIILYLF